MAKGAEHTLRDRSGLGGADLAAVERAGFCGIRMGNGRLRANGPGLLLGAVVFRAAAEEVREAELAADFSATASRGAVGPEGDAVAESDQPAALGIERELAGQIPSDAGAERDELAVVVADERRGFVGGGEGIVPREAVVDESRRDREGIALRLVGLESSGRGRFGQNVNAGVDENGEAGMGGNFFPNDEVGRKAVEAGRQIDRWASDREEHVDADAGVVIGFEPVAPRILGAELETPDAVDGWSRL